MGEQQENVLRYLRDTPNSNISLELKCKLKAKRPTPKLSIKTTSGKSHNRSFQCTWYKRFPWLTGCNVVNKMYCYRCLLFGSKDTEWCVTGVLDLNNFIKKAVKHQASENHLLNEEKFHLLGKTGIDHVLSEAARLQALKHNEEVKNNREVLGRIIQAIIFLSKNELAFHGEGEDETCSNKGNYLSLLDLLAQNQSLLRDHLNSTSFFKGTSSEIQNDLIEVITFVVNEKILSEIQQSYFISIQADETLDISCKSQMSIIFRYCFKGKIEERFAGFYDVSENKTAVGLSRNITDVLKKWGIEGNKVVSQTYDGATLMAGSERKCAANSENLQIVKRSENNVHHLIRQEYCSHALFIHCYAHQLHLVVLHGSKNIKEVKLFISDLTSFHSFFSKSSKRIVLLTEKGFKVPQAISARWNFNSRAVSTIIHFFSNLYEVLDNIIEDVNEQWDCDSISCARGLKSTMDDTTFVFLLFVYEACFLHLNNLFTLLQSISTAINICQNELKLALTAIENLRCESFLEECFKKSMEINQTLIFPEKEKHKLKILLYEVLDVVVVQVKRRFSDLGELNFLDLINENMFLELKHKPLVVREKIVDLIKQFPFFDGEKLENEFSNLYIDEEKHLSPRKLLDYFISTGLDSVYSEVCKLLHLVHTFPATSISSDRSVSTLKRVKSYLRNSMTNNRLSNLSTLAVEKELLGELSSDPKFLSRVIDVFAEKKSREMDFVFKITR